MAMPKFDDVDAYLAAQPEPARSVLQDLREQIHTLVPGAQDYLSYGCPAFRLDERRAFAGFARFAKHNSYLPHSGSVLPVLAEERLLDGYTWTPGSLHFPLDEGLPEPLLRRLLSERLGRPV